MRNRYRFIYRKVLGNFLLFSLYAVRVVGTKRKETSLPVHGINRINSKTTGGPRNVYAIVTFVIYINHVSTEIITINLFVDIVIKVL